MVLAHLVGDFPLQTDRVFYYKHRTRWGILIHIGITALCNVVFTIPYLRYPGYWLILFAMAVLHLIYDRTKIILTLKKNMPDNFPLFLFDQFLHFGTIYLATLLFYRWYPGGDAGVSGFYANVQLIQLLSGLVLIMFAIAPVNYFLINDFYAYVGKKNRPHWQFPAGKDRIWGYLERGMLGLALSLQGWWLILLPFAFLPRPLFLRGGNSLDFALSVFFSATIGLGMHFWIWG